MLATGVDRLSRAGIVLAAVLVLAIGALVLLDVVTRWIGFSPAFIANSILLAMVWLSYAGCAYAHRVDAHVAVDTVLRLLPARMRASVMVLNEVICLGISAVILWSSWQQVSLSFTYDAKLLGTFRLPTWIAQVSVPVCMLLFFLQSAMKLRQLVTRRGDSDARVENAER